MMIYLKPDEELTATPGEQVDSHEDLVQRVHEARRAAGLEEK